MKLLLLFNCSVTSDSFVTPWTVARQAPLSMGFPRQEYWRDLPLPPPGDHLDPGIKPASRVSPALAWGFCTTSATWEAHTLALTAPRHRAHCPPPLVNPALFFYPYVSYKPSLRQSNRPTISSLFLGHVWMCFLSKSWGFVFVFLVLL